MADLGEILSSGPIVTGSTHPGHTVEASAARSAAQTVAERVPRDDILRLLHMLGITGKDGPEDGRWAVYAYGRPSTTLKGGEACLSTR